MKSKIELVFIMKMVLNYIIFCEMEINLEKNEPDTVVFVVAPSHKMTFYICLNKG